MKAGMSMKSGNKLSLCLFQWAGGKVYQAYKIARYWPNKQFKRYFEPFFGAGGSYFYLWKSGRAPEEVIVADRSEELIHMYQTLRDKPHEVYNYAIQFEKANKELFEYFYYLTPKDDIERAVRFMYVARYFISGLALRKRQKPSFSADSKKSWPSRDFWSIVEAIQNVRFVHGSFEETIPLYADADTFMYCDPPYFLQNERKPNDVYGDLFRREDHVRLCELVSHAVNKGTAVMISNAAYPYVREFYREHLPTFEQHTFSTSYSFILRRNNRQAQELVLTSYSVDADKGGGENM